MANPREPSSVPARASPVLEIVTLVLEHAEEPMRAREIRVAAEQLAGKPLLLTSVKAALAAYTENCDARFERVQRGCYGIKTSRVIDKHV